MHVDVEGFNLDLDFTIASWVLSEEQPCNACVISVENLIRIGEFDKEGLFRVSCRRGAEKQQAFFYDLDSKKMGEKFVTQRWYHLVFLRCGDRIEFYVDGDCMGTQDAPSVSMAKKVSTKSPVIHCHWK